MGGNHSRNKGAQFERDIVNKFKEIYPEAARNFEYLPGAELGVDIFCGPFKIQCKRYAKYCNPSKISECTTDSKGVPILITKGDRLPSMVVINLEAFIEILKEGNFGSKNIGESGRRGKENDGREDHA